MVSPRHLNSIHRNSSLPNMNFFADTRSKRNTAFAMLLVWVFALASGVANACLLETPGHHFRAVKGPAAATLQAPTEWVAHLDATAGHHDDADSIRPSCLKACDDGTQGLPKANSGVDHADPGPPTLVTTQWTRSMPVVSAPRRVDGWVMPVVGPPLRVRYSRLAL